MELIGKPIYLFGLEEDVPKTNEAAAAIFSCSDVEIFCKPLQKKDEGIL